MFPGAWVNPKQQFPFSGLPGQHIQEEDRKMIEGNWRVILDRIEEDLAFTRKYVSDSEGFMGDLESKKRGGGHWDSTMFAGCMGGGSC